MRIDSIDTSKDGQAKFLVVDGKVYITKIVDMGHKTSTHPELGREDFVHSEIIRLRKEKPSEVCAGSLFIIDHAITLLCDSSGYKLPVIDSGSEQYAMEAFQRIIAPGIILKLIKGAAYQQNAILMLD